MRGRGRRRTTAHRGGGATVPCVLATLLVAAFLLTWQTPATACSCAPDPPPDEARATAAAVFSGTVTDVRTVGRGVHEDQVATVEVDEVFGGEVAEVAAVSTPADDGMCGVGFAVGDRWLLYASQREDGSFATHACTRTAALAYAEEGWTTGGQAERDIAALGPGSAPVPGEQPRSEPFPWQWLVVPAVVAAIVLVVIMVRRTA